MKLERKTAVSKAVIKIVHDAERPLSVSQITEKLNADKLFPNKSTVYRILEKLKEEVLEVKSLDGVSYYEKKCKSHHHHFFCKKCEQVYCLKSCKLETQGINLQNMLPDENFKIFSHELNVYGDCGCQN